MNPIDKECRIKAICLYEREEENMPFLVGSEYQERGVKNTEGKERITKINTTGLN